MNILKLLDFEFSVIVFIKIEERYINLIYMINYFKNCFYNFFICIFYNIYFKIKK